MTKDIQELSLEDVMGDRFSRYSKYIIQDRALPDIRDGLKPVQRRILYAMYRDGNTYDRAFRKSAKTVGNVIGNYHPHGDFSVYEAMVRMSQWWKNRHNLIEMHGNNGSMDGDPAAAMRYTEARLTKIANELLTDLEKDTVETILNFDDTEYEPLVLPAAFPNLLVNGATGISAGYATNIPTHNLAEVIDALLYVLDHPEAKLEAVMNYLPGPDFPTGAIIQGKKGLKEAYQTGKGKIVLRAKCDITKIKSGKQTIVIKELPYDVNKADLVQKIDDIRLNKTLEDIIEVRDESDRQGIQISIDLKKGADAEFVLNYLYKKTPLQVNFNFNMVAISQKKPKQVGLLDILKAYLDHRFEVVTRRTEFDLLQAKKRDHIVAGLIKAVSILDDIIQVIRQSKNKSNARENIMAKFQFSYEQAEAIISLQLYRLSNTDILSLEEEQITLEKKIKHFEGILQNNSLLNNELKTELKAIKKTYGTPRYSEIESSIDKIVINKEDLISDENVMTIITREGYVKRTSERSFQASQASDLGMREGDRLVYLAKHSLLDHLLFFTSKGHYIYQPIHELQDIKWNSLGEHLSQRIPFEPDEEIIKVLPYDEASEAEVLLATKGGFIKRTLLEKFTEFRGYKKRTGLAMNLEGEDLVLTAELLTHQEEVMVLSHLGFALRYPLEEISLVGPRAKGVKAIDLKANDYVVNAIIPYHQDLDQQEILLGTQRKYMKRLKWTEVNLLGRARRGLVTLREVKSNPHYLIAAFSLCGTDDQFELLASHHTKAIVRAGDIPIFDRYSNGHHLKAAKIDPPIKKILKILPLEEIALKYK